MKPTLFIMVKEPHPGRVKTRLGRDLGLTSAAWWFRHQTRKLIRAVGYDPRWQTVLAVSPDIEGLKSRIWPADLPRWAQGQGDLGDRMGRIFCEGPLGSIVIVGADIPNITPHLINKAFRALGNHDAVFGPAPDGGYWLIGLKNGVNAVPSKMFENVRWSTEHALSDTIATLGDMRVAMIDTLQDVDTIRDLDGINQQS
ncbi:glycosyltransferase [Amylibacter sp. SFDW26]|uniref:TIGR04282 family arsenosugar biosynthesis glycosyltransferase n=1 Tax=Amylibacter sp. SFDW26 TaxID=2652722 RepID=UPI00126221B4|nr:TIGR04282 family arsenosugar biosynthesis glycosyltransferase [Amylibacter sp. SFDW26]KAB7614836.1 glycosyltransferase [Amylibacter sp. SFDW26]